MLQICNKYSWNYLDSNVIFPLFGHIFLAVSLLYYVSSWDNRI